VVPDACVDVSLSVSGPVNILGVGNGDPAWRDPERPEDPSQRAFSVKTFGGLAQVLLQSRKGEGGEASLSVSGSSVKGSAISVSVR